MTNILEVKNLNVELGGVKVLDEINFELEEGEVLAVIGPNGAGKTILLKALLGLLPYKGNVAWRPGVKIGYVPQRIEIDTDVPLSVREFFDLRGGRFSSAAINEAIRLVQLKESILKSGLGEISVGQRQRILVAWATITKPEVLLFDEPTADIDVRGQASIYQMLYGLQTRMRLSIILISHDLNVVYRYASRVLCLNRRKVCLGSPKEALTTNNLHELYGGERAFYQHIHR